MASLPGLPKLPPAWAGPTGTPVVGTLPAPPVVNYPTAAQQQALNAQSLPGAWGNWFSSVYGALDKYYTPERGGPAQAQYDFANWRNLFAQLVGRPPTAEDFAGVLGGYREWALANNRAVTLSGLYEWMRQVYGERPRPPLVSYARVTGF